MELQYSKSLQSVSAHTSPCPPAEALAQDRTVWRWVSASMSSDDFKPQALRNPPRLHQAKDLEEMCSCWALSIFVSESSCRKAFLKLQAKMPRIRNVLGGHMALAELTLKCGVITPESSSGHADFHPASTFNYSEKFAYLGEIK